MQYLVAAALPEGVTEAEHPAQRLSDRLGKNKQTQSSTLLACRQAAAGCGSPNFCEGTQVQARSVLRQENAQENLGAARCFFCCCHWQRRWHSSLFKD